MDFTFDESSLLLTCPVDAPLKEIDAACAARSLFLGYLPEKKVRTLREALESGVRNLLAERYGEIDDLCAALSLRKGGRLMRTRNLPRSATGPDFKKLLATGGGFGTLLEVTLRLSPKPEATASLWISWTRKAFRSDFFRLFWGSGIRPSLLGPRGENAVDVRLEGLADVVAAETGALRSMVRTTRGKIHARS